MSAPANPIHRGIHHLKLPVTDLERSADWYRTVLGAHRLTELDHRRADGTLFAVILDVPGFPGRLELRLDPVTAKALNGYDLLTLSVTDRVAIDHWVARLDTLDIPHSPPIVALIGWLLVVPDPDGLRLRFYTTEPHRLGADAVEFDSPWLGAGVVAETASAAGESAVCAVGRLTALPGYRDRVLARMRSLEDIIRQEDGCLRSGGTRCAPQDCPYGTVRHIRYAPGGLAATAGFTHAVDLTAGRNPAFTPDFDREPRLEARRPRRNRLCRRSIAAPKSRHRGVPAR
ncbi:VOC family protein [Nocardia sp. NPDC006630]|uniref:VOC family protein n=1 Tax=Nocardia sp. NPDC006630 TaxID=3157181 RepID=UPI0033BAE709